MDYDENSLGSAPTMGSASVSGRRIDFDEPSLGSAPTMVPGGESSSSEPSLGRIDQYELVRKLGGGGFGVVYLARDTISGIEVALKTLHPLLKSNAEEMERLREKFALVSRLAHPNIASPLVLHPVREVSIADEAVRHELHLATGDSVMVMRYAPGVTLSKWRRQFPGGVVPLDQALEIGRQIASALDYAHGEKIVHRDIKPANVMVETLSQPSDSQADFGLRVRILDFGLAAEIRSSMSRVSTEKGDTSGTRPYMAPEQWQGRRQDGRTDQYALACVLYELLSGEPPFAGAFETGDPAIMANAVENRQPDELGDFPAEVNDALQKALSKNQADRFGNCSGFVAALAAEKSPRLYVVASVDGEEVQGAVLTIWDQKVELPAQLQVETGWTIDPCTIQLDLPGRGKFNGKTESMTVDWKGTKSLIVPLSAITVPTASATGAASDSSQAIIQNLVTGNDGRTHHPGRWLLFVLTLLVVAGGTWFWKSHLLPQSDSSDAESFFNKGEDYYLGRNGCRQDDAEAVKWYRKAAELGDARGQNSLGVMYDEGRGVPQDGAEAVKWYRMAAEQGNARGQVNLGLMYVNGLGVQQSDAEALKWFSMAAEQGDAVAQRNIGLMYELGRGVPQDDAEAVKWYRKSAERGNADGQANLGLMYGLGRGVRQDDAEAVKWYRKAADQGDATGQFYLGMMYEDGRGVQQDDAEAVKWYRKAAEQGDSRGLSSLGRMYAHGRGVRQDDSEAVKLFRKAAELGNADGQNNLGSMCQNGQGVAQDDAEAVKWYRMAAEQGDSDGQVSLGLMYKNGRGVPKSDTEAVKWFRKSAEQGNARGQGYLGSMYQSGRGVTQSDAEALKWYRMAAEQGDEGAKRSLYLMCLEGRGSSQDDEVAKVTATEKRTAAKMRRIEIPTIKFFNADINDVVGFLRQASRDYDDPQLPSGKRGVNLTLDLTPNPDDVPVDDPFAIAEDSWTPPVSFTATSIDLYTVLQVITDISGLTFSISGNNVVIMPDYPSLEPIRQKYEKDGKTSLENARKEFSSGNYVEAKRLYEVAAKFIAKRPGNEKLIDEALHGVAWAEEALQLARGTREKSQPEAGEPNSEIQAKADNSPKSPDNSPQEKQNAGEEMKHDNTGQSGSTASSIFSSVKDGLIVWYDFDDIQSATSDKSGFDNHGTVTGAKWGRDRFGNGYFTFDGLPGTGENVDLSPDDNHDFIRLGVDTSGFPLQDFTISIVCRPLNGGTIIGSGQNELWCREWALKANGFDWAWIPGRSSGGVGRQGTKLEFSSLYKSMQHLVVKRNGSMVVVYRNGVELARSHAFSSQRLPIYSYGLFIGTKEHDEYTRWRRWDCLKGDIYSVMIWNRGLTDNQIASLWKDLNGKYRIANAVAKENPPDTTSTQPQRHDTDKQSGTQGVEVLASALGKVRSNPTAANVTSMEKAWFALSGNERTRMQESVIGASCAFHLLNGDKDAFSRRKKYLTDSDFWSSVTDECRSCDGSGHVEKDCSACKGSGTCPTCGGSGRFGGGYFRGAMSANPSVACSSCKGSGQCSSCRGGRTRANCTKCSGAGRVLSKVKCREVFERELDEAMDICRTQSF